MFGFFFATSYISFILTEFRGSFMGKVYIAQQRPWDVKFPIICFSGSQYRFEGAVSRFSGIAAESVKNIGLKENSDCYGKR